MIGALKGLAVRLRALGRRSQAERDLDEEIRFHIEQETAKYVRAGASAEEARRRALVAFGGVTQTREAHRAVRGAPWVEELVADSRYALRALRRSPVLAGAAILTLALGIGANTAIFSAVNAVLLRPLPFAAAERLYMLWEENPDRGWHRQTAAPANMLDWREQVVAFEDVAAYGDLEESVTLTGVGDPRPVRKATVTGNFFSVLGVRAALGRTLRAEETWATGAAVAVVGHRLWRDHFRGDAGVIGRTVHVDGRPVEIVGVMPDGFAFPFEDVDVWRPTAWNPANEGQTWFRRAHWLRPIARLRPGVSAREADAQLQAVAQRLQRDYPETNTRMGAGMTSLHEFLVGDTRLPLLVLMGAVALLLLIACANVGNLLLVQAAGRERETALRLALGAGRGRLVRQALTESLVLSAIGGAGGLALGWWGTRALQALQPAGMLRVSQFGVDWRVLAYVLAVTVATGLLFGTAPALWSRRQRPAEALREAGRTESEGRRARRWGNALAVGEVALALLLLVGAGLLVRSLLRLQQVHPGFDHEGVLTATVGLPGVRYDTPEKVSAFFDELVMRARALPGATDAAAVTRLPLTTTSWSSDLAVAGRPVRTNATEVLHRAVTPDYFRVMRIPLRRGRAFTSEDRAGAPPVVLINEALAREHFRGEDPVGQRIAFERVTDSSSIWHTIVGIVGSENQSTLMVEPRTEVFAPAAQDPSNTMRLVVRTVGEPASLGAPLRRLVAEIDPALAVRHVSTMAEIRAASLARERFLTTLLLAFAAVGLLLAVVGVYGVMAQLVRHRRREMGIRLALGAQVPQVRWLVVQQGLRLVAIGLVTGTAGALLATRVVRVLLFGVEPADPVTFVVVPAVLAVTGLAASWLPARQASRADPAGVLRAE